MNNDVVIYQSSDGLVKMEAIVDASNETNLICALTGHKEGSNSFARYRKIDEDTNRKIISLLE